MIGFKKWKSSLVLLLIRPLKMKKNIKSLKNLLIPLLNVTTMKY